MAKHPLDMTITEKIYIVTCTLSAPTLAPDSNIALFDALIELNIRLKYGVQ